jgi:iron complex outermembrane receptor protein
MTLNRTRAALLGFTALSGVLALTAGMATPAMAADAPAAPAAESGAVAEVVVTGALRSQRLQDAPLAVTSVAPQEFINAGFKEPRELQFLSPSIQVSIQGANAIYIRGSGTNSQNGGTEQSVGLVLDGVLQGFVDDIGADISDLDHVEVYSGPQGTQFAKNASAGVVTIMTKNPQIGVFGVTTHASYGEHNDTSDDATVNIPINDTLAARLTAGFQHRDGVFYNDELKFNQGGREQKSFRAKLLWEPKERMSFLLDVDGRLTFDKPNFPQAWAFCGPPTTTSFINYTGTKTLPACNGSLAAGIVPSPTNSVITEQDDAYRHTQAGGVGLTSSIPLGDFTLTSITAFRSMSREFFGPTGSGIYTNSYLHNWYNGGQSSEEIRLISPVGKKFTYVGGIYLYDRDTVTKSCGCGPAYLQAQQQYPNTPYGSAVWVSSTGGQTKSHNVDKSYAAYADGSYHITDKLQINAGARITYDDIFASIADVQVPGVYNSPGTILTSNGLVVIPATVNTAVNPTIYLLPYRQLDITHTGYTYRIGPQYFFTPDIQAYATYGHGYKGPLIDTSVNTLNPVLPEEVDMFEVGMKTAWFEHRLIADITAFHEQFHNYQVSVLNQTVTPNVFQLGNAGGELSQGIELNLQAKPVNDFSLKAALTFNDSHYTDFVTSCWNAAEPIKQATTGINGCYIHPGNTTASTNAAGTPLINASKWTYTVGGTYTHTYANQWKVDATANYFWRSSWLSAPMDPNIVNPAYGVVGLNGGVTTPDGRYRFGVFVRNALNTFFLAGRQSNNGGWTNVLNPEAVRTVGVNFTGKFE